MSFYNTTNEKGKDLKQSEIKAEKQEQKVLQLYKSWLLLTASECWKLYGVDKCPLTSIRRAITNLSNEGKLIKTGYMKIGIYGKKEHSYRLVKTQMELFPTI